MGFVKIQSDQIKDNIFQMLGRDWTLITAKKGDAVNMMTASWGMAGILWNKPVTEVFIRPQRYTREFVDNGATYALCFFGREYREQMTLCGSRSGRDLDKVAACGFTVATELDTPYFREARLVLICRKIYQHDLDPSLILDPGIDSAHYPGKDYHRLYIGEILSVLQKDGE